MLEEWNTGQKLPIATLFFIASAHFNGDFTKLQFMLRIVPLQ